MGDASLDAVLRHLRRLSEAGTAGSVADADLLRRYIEARDEAAFELLVRRHGTMVLGVCRRVLRHEQDAENAFQATFLILLRKARSIRQQQSLSGWLYQVACHSALRLRKLRAQRHARETVLNGSEPTARGEATPTELRGVLDEEVSRLPARYRAPFILCCLQGNTYEEAARQLGYPEGTVATQLHRARQRLRVRLRRRGWEASAALTGALLAEESASASLPASLIQKTLQLMQALKPGAVGASVGATEVAALTQGVIRSMFMSKLRVALSCVLAIGVIGLGADGVIQRACGDRLVAQPPEEKPDQREAPQKATAPKPSKHADAPARPDAKRFANAPGCRWLVRPMAVGGGHVGPAFIGTPLVAESYDEDKDGALVVTLAYSGVLEQASPVTGRLSPRFRPVAFDSQYVRYPLTQNGSSGCGSDKKTLDELRRLDPANTDVYIDANASPVTLACYHLDRKLLPASDVAYLGVEFVPLEGFKREAEAAIEQAKARGIAVLPFPAVGKPYDFALTSLDRIPRRSRDLHGKVVLIDCWASWCAPCIAQIQSLKTHYARWHEQGLEIIGVNWDFSPQQARQACHKYAIPWPQVHVPAQNDVRTIWESASTVVSLPRLLLIDREGTLRAAEAPADLEKTIERMLRESADRPRTTGPEQP